MNIDDIIIRKMTSADTEKWLRLGNLVWRSAYARIFSEEIFEAREKETQERGEKINANGVNINGHIGFVAIYNDKIIGFVSGTVTSYYKHYVDLGCSDLTAIYIHPDFQRIGLGKKFFDVFTAELKKAGCNKMAIGVLKENTQAQRAYEKWGGELDYHTESYTTHGKEYPQVFYVFNLN
jgi:GNAT superfamily N-acetyltransferase